MPTDQELSVGVARRLGRIDGKTASGVLVHTKYFEVFTKLFKYVMFVFYGTLISDDETGIYKILRRQGSPPPSLLTMCFLPVKSLLSLVPREPLSRS